MVSSQEQSTTPTGTTLRVIFAVIENQKASLQIVQALAHETRYFVLVVNNYEQMLNIAEDASPDLFLFDYTSENGNGMAHYRQLRTHLSYRNMPVVVLNTPFTKQAHEDEMLVCLPQSTKYNTLLFAIDMLLTRREHLHNRERVDWSVMQCG